MAESPVTFDSTSSSLLDRVRLRDGEAWRHLVRLYAPLVYFWCGRAGIRGEDAADVLQEVFRSVAVAIGDFRHDRLGDTFRGWLHVITLNKVHDMQRRRAGEPVAVGGSEHQALLSAVPLADDAAEDDAQQSRNAVLRRALDLIRLEFEERTWQAFWRTTVDGQATADVAADLKMTSTAVRKARSRVFRRLRQALADPLEAM